MADGVDASVDHMQAAALQPVPDPVSTEANPKRLPARHHPVLPCRQFPE